jgi:hypothetical protein
MAQTWISHDIIEDNAVTVQYSISEYEAQSQAYQDQNTAYTGAATTAAANKVIVDGQLAIWLAVPGRPA